MLASVAQSVVHLTRNEKGACSSHVTSSKKVQPKWAGLFWIMRDSNNKLQQSSGLLQQPVQKLVASIL